MSHQTIEQFIGEVLHTDVQHLKRATELLRERARRRGNEIDCLIGDIRHLGEFLQARARNHFRLTRHLGTCAGLAEERPRLASMLHKLEIGQDKLTEQLAVVRGACETVDLTQPESFAALEESLDELTRMFAAHAEEEDLFVLEAYNQEIGAMD